MNPLRFLLSLWHQRQRRIDLQILWPACKANSKSLEAARTAFAAHCYSDPAWDELGPDELARTIAALE